MLSNKKYFWQILHLEYNWTFNFNLASNTSIEYAITNFSNESFGEPTKILNGWS
jgi:hypothetical protein